jgi:hypothetical protein
MRVQTADGPTDIRDVRAGDVVYSWNDGELAARRVVRRNKRKYQQTYRLRTLHREIVASGDRAFLTLHPWPKATRRCSDGCDRPVRGRGLCGTHYAYRRNHGTVPPLERANRITWEVQWVELQYLRRDDVVVALRSLSDEISMSTDPLLADRRFLWLLGLAFGDGSLSRHRANRVDLCVFGTLREEVQQRLEDFCGKRGSETDKHGVYLFSETLALGFRRLGMDTGSTDRVLPRELWVLPHLHIQAFLDGYTAADGHCLKRASDPALNYKAANRGLIEDVRNLHMILGHNVTWVRELKRTRPIVIKGKEVRNARSLWTFEAYETGKKTTNAAAGLLGNWGIRQHFPADSHFTPQKVTSIEPLDGDGSYEITVEGTHNYVADGLPIHNSGFVDYIGSSGSGLVFGAAPRLHR